MVFVFRSFTLGVLVNKKVKVRRKGVNTLCPGSSDSFYVVTHYLNGSLLPGHTVLCERPPPPVKFVRYIITKKMSFYPVIPHFSPSPLMIRD